MDLLSSRVYISLTVYIVLLVILLSYVQHVFLIGYIASSTYFVAQHQECHITDNAPLYKEEVTTTRLLGVGAAGGVDRTVAASRTTNYHSLETLAGRERIGRLPEAEAVDVDTAEVGATAPAVTEATSKLAIQLLAPPET